MLDRFGLRKIGGLFSKKSSRAACTRGYLSRVFLTRSSESLPPFFFCSYGGHRDVYSEREIGITDELPEITLDRKRCLAKSGLCRVDHHLLQADTFVALASGDYKLPIPLLVEGIEKTCWYSCR